MNIRLDRQAGSIRLLGKLQLACMTIVISACASTPQVDLTDSSEVLAAMRRADRAYVAGNCEQALPLYLRLSRKMPEDSHLWFRMGNCYSLMGSHSAAQNAWDKAVANEPDHHGAWNNLVMGQINQAAETLIEMRAASPGNAELADRLDGLISELLDVVSRHRREDFDELRSVWAESIRPQALPTKTAPQKPRLALPAKKAVAPPPEVTPAKVEAVPKPVVSTQPPAKPKPVVKAKPITPVTQKPLPAPAPEVRPVRATNKSPARNVSTPVYQAPALIPPDFLPPLLPVERPAPAERDKADVN